jgi:hypothetical protein
VSWEPGATDVARGCADAAGSQIGGARGRHPRGLRSEGPHRRVRPRSAGVRWLTRYPEKRTRRTPRVLLSVRVRAASPVTTAISVGLAPLHGEQPAEGVGRGARTGGRRQQRESTARSSWTPTLRGLGSAGPGASATSSTASRAPGEPTIITSISDPVISTEPPQPAPRAGQARRALPGPRLRLRTRRRTAEAVRGHSFAQRSSFPQPQTRRSVKHPRCPLLVDALGSLDQFRSVPRLISGWSPDSPRHAKFRGRITTQIDRNPDRPLTKVLGMPRCCHDSHPSVD